MINDPIAKSSVSNNGNIICFSTACKCGFSSLMRAVMSSVYIYEKNQEYNLVLHQSPVSLVHSLPYSSCWHKIIHSSTLLLIPISFILYHRDSLSVESDAFSKSTKHQYIDPLFYCKYLSLF